MASRLTGFATFYVRMRCFWKGYGVGSWCSCRARALRPPWMVSSLSLFVVLTSSPVCVPLYLYPVTTSRRIVNCFFFLSFHLHVIISLPLHRHPCIFPVEHIFSFVSIYSTHFPCYSNCTCMERIPTLQFWCSAPGQLRSISILLIICKNKRCILFTKKQNLSFPRMYLWPPHFWGFE